MKQKCQYRGPRLGEVLSFLNRHATHVEYANSKDVRFSPCPACKRDSPTHTSNTINKDSGLWFCWSCQARGNFFTLTRAFEHPLSEEDRYLEPPAFDRKKIEVGYAAMMAYTKRRPVIEGHHPELLKYCHERGFTNDTLECWRVSTKGATNLRWPIYAWQDDGWAIVNARLRACLEREKATTKDWFEVSGGETGLLLGNHLLNLEATEGICLITEGQWDAMTAYQMGMANVFSLPNGAGHVDVARMLRYIPETWEIWLAVDMDTAGDQCAEKFFHQLGPDRLARCYMPHKDLNAWYQETKGTLTIAQLMKTAKGFTHKVTSSTKTERGYLKLGAETEAPVKQEIVIDTPWPKLTKLLGGGLKQKQTTGILAPSGVGKTTLVNQWGIYAAAKGVRTGLISLEGSREELAEIIGIAMRALPDKRDAIADNLSVSALEGLRVTWQEALKEMEKMATEGCRLLILDNLDFIMPRLNPNAANTQKVEAYGRIVEMAKNLNTHILVVWQPNKIEQGVIVNSGMQKGASQCFQDAHNYLNLNRVEELARVEVEKCRGTGVQKDRHVWMLYDDGRRWLDEVEPSTADKKRFGVSKLSVVT